MLFQGEGDCQVSLRTPNISVVNWTVLLRLDPISNVQTLLNLLHVIYYAALSVVHLFCFSINKMWQLFKGENVFWLSADFCHPPLTEQHEHLVHIITREWAINLDFIAPVQYIYGCFDQFVD